MAERFATRYPRLFEVQVLHHYWLDDGGTVFAAAADSRAGTKRLLGYDVRQLLTVTPTAATAALIAGLRGVFRTTGLGFFVAVPEGTTLPLDATLEFLVSASDPDYANYTALGLRPRPITEVPDPADPHVVRRFQENVPLLTNLTGTSVEIGGRQRLFLSSPYPTTLAADEDLEAVMVDGTRLRELLGGPPADAFHDLATTAPHLVYVHQGDVVAIPAPAGVAGVPARGVELPPDAPRALVALVRLAAQRPNADAFDLVTGQGGPRTPAPVFEVHLRNRWTLWRYRRRSDDAVTSEAGPFPLTRFGNPHSALKPSPSALVVEPAAGQPWIVSEIRP